MISKHPERISARTKSIIFLGGRLKVTKIMQQRLATLKQQQRIGVYTWKRIACVFSDRWEVRLFIYKNTAFNPSLPNPVYTDTSLRTIAAYSILNCTHKDKSCSSRSGLPVEQPDIKQRKTVTVYRRDNHPIVY